MKDQYPSLLYHRASSPETKNFPEVVAARTAVALLETFTVTLSWVKDEVPFPRELGSELKPGVPDGTFAGIRKPVMVTSAFRQETPMIKSPIKATAR